MFKELRSDYQEHQQSNPKSGFFKNGKAFFKFAGRRLKEDVDSSAGAVRREIVAFRTLKLRDCKPQISAWHAAKDSFVFMLYAVFILPPLWLTKHDLEK